MRVEVTTKNMDALKAPEGAYILHAVNCQGVMGAGFAAQVKEQAPDSYKVYYETCKYFEENDMTDALAGTCLITDNEKGNNSIVHLFTSNNFGKQKDAAYEILKNTKSALDSFFQHLLGKQETKIKLFCVKFNSGLFGVDWKLTTDVIKQSLFIYHYSAIDKSFFKDIEVDLTICVL